VSSTPQKTTVFRGGTDFRNFFNPFKSLKPKNADFAVRYVTTNQERAQRQWLNLCALLLKHKTSLARGGKGFWSHLYQIARKSCLDNSTSHCFAIGGITPYLPQQNEPEAI